MLRSLALPLAAALALAVPARAQAPMRLGYFDVKRILLEVDDAKSAKGALQKEFEEKQKKLDEQKTELERMEKEFKQKAAVLSQSAKEQLAVELQSKAMAAQKLFVELQQDLQGKEQQALAGLLQKLEPVVREIAEQEGYTFIFEKNEAGVFYAPAQHDITAQVIRRYNDRNPTKAGGGTAPADKKPAPAKVDPKKPK